MQSRKVEQEGTTKPNRTPRNLLEYILNKSINEDLFPLLAKHHKSLKALLDCNTDISELKSAIFIIDLNKFSNDLAKISELCAKIDIEMHAYHSNLKRSRDALQAYSSKDLASAISSFYIDARNYDERFPVRHWLPKVGGKPLLSTLFLLANPFRHDPDLSNEENIFNLIAAFKIHDDFFRNYLNVLYGDGKEGEEFLRRSFELISAEYKKIKDTIADISKIIPDSAPEKVVKSVERKRRIVEKIIEKYPATLYLATKKLLLHFEGSASTSLTPQSGRP